MVLRRIALAVAALGLVIPGAVSGASDVSAGEQMRARIVAAAHEAGVDPELVLGHEITARLPGSSLAQRVTLDDLFEAFSAMPTVAGGAGPEVLSGDFVHGFVDYSLTGRGDLASYDVRTSSLAPATPPIYPPDPVGTHAYDVGGPMRTISGGGWVSGWHTVGSYPGFGGNVSTAPGSPEPYPVWVPVQTGGLTTDTSIDFMGHALVAQDSICLFGICISYGLMYGTGAATFNTEPAFPAVP